METVMERFSISDWRCWTNPDDWGGSFNEDVERRLKFHVDLGWDIIMTHNPQGEYGHTQHQTLNRILTRLVPSNLWIFGTDLRPLSFSALKDKLDILSLYKIHGDLGVWDWYDQNDPSNHMMKYVVSEGFRRVK